VDDVFLGEAPSCPPVTALAAANIAPDNFDLSWMNGGAETQWIIEYTAVCAGLGTGTTLISNSNPANISGLTPETAYDVYVAAICAPGDTSVYAGPIVVTTPPSCPPATNFAGTVMGTDINLTWTSTESNFEIEWGPAGFTPGGGGTIVPVTGLTADFNGLMFGTFYEFYITTICGADMSAQVGPLSLGTPPGCGGSFFDTGGPGGNYSDFENYSTTICPDNPGDVVTLTFTFVDIETAGTGGNFNGCWDFIEIYDGLDTNAPLLFAGCGEPDLNPSDPTFQLSPGDFFTSTDASGCLTIRFESDDIINEPGWEATIACTPPVTCVQPTNLTASAVGNSIDFSWVSTDMNFNVEWGVAGFMPGTGTIVPVMGATTVNIPGLMNGTEYDFYVQADCGNGDLSIFAGPVSATTAPGCGSGFTDSGGTTGGYQNSEDITTTICPDVPGELVSVVFTYVDIETTTIGGSNGTGCWDFLEIYDGADTNAPLVGSFCGEESGDGGVPVDPISLLSVGDVFTSSDASGCLTFRFVSDTSVPETGWEASVTCAPPPPCDNPTNLSAVLTGGDMAFVEWDSTAMDYEVIYVETGMANDMGIAIPVMGDTSTTITGLASNTTYDIYVVGVCGPLSVSDTVGPVMIMTPPSCGDQFTDTGGTGGGYTANEDYFVTVCPNVPGTIVTIDFTYVDIETSTGAGSNGNGCWDFLEIYDGDDANAPLIGSFCGEADGDGGSPSNSVSELLPGDSFTSSAASGCLTFHFVSDGSVQETGWEANVLCDTPPACPDAGGLQTITVATDTADVSWISGASEFIVEYGEAGFELGSGTVINTMDTFTTLTGLMEQTTYDVYVQSACTPVSDIIMTGAIDGPLSGGLPKAIEFYATKTVTDLDQYGFGSANNGGGTDGIEVTFPNDTIPACTFFYLSTDSASFATFFGFNATYIDQDLGNDFAASINGDDALELFYQGTVIDVFGDINVDGTGEPWDHVDGWAYRNDGQSNNDGTFDAMNWFFSGPDALDGDTLNSTSSTPFPIGTFDSPVGCPAGPLTFETPCAPVLGDSIQNPFIIDLTMDTTVMGNTANCYTDQIGSDANDVFYQLNVDPCVATITLTTCNGSDYDTRLRLLDAAGVEVATNDDDCGLQSTISDFDVIGGDTYFAVVEGFNGLSNGNYTLDVTLVEKNITIAPDAVNNPLCNGDMNGEILITVDGGVGPYTFMWSNGGTTEDITGLSAGDYTGSITDAEGCEIVSPTITLIDPAVLEVDLGTLVVQSPLCNGESTGIIDITTIGGTAPYTYMWSNGDTDEDLVGIPSGSYTGSITDANGCTYVSPTISLVDPAVLEVDLNASVVTDPLCNGETTGVIDIATVGGTEPYTYMWSNGATTEDLNGVGAGDYVGSITDANGCTFVSPTLTLTDPPLLTASATTVDETVPGAEDGAIDVTPAGGTPDYTFMWSNGASTEDIDGLAGGDYTITITDGNGCEIVETYGLLTDVNNIQTLELFTLTPNPTDGQVLLTLGFTQSESIRLEIVNVLGQVLHREDMTAVNFLQKEMSLDNFAAGIYYVRIISEDKIATRELILSR
ncbi:MAG: CUB domain-containing protein, partial [Bacteroidota bacterium]